MQSELYTASRFRSAIAHFLVGRAAQALASFALTLWLVRLLSPRDYGAYMTLWGLVETMVPLSSLGILEAVRKFLPDIAKRGARGVLSKFVHWMTIVRLIMVVSWAVLIALYWPDVAGWMGFSQPQQDATILAVVLIITVLGFRFSSEMLECLLEQRWSQSTRALMAVGRLVGVGALVASETVSLGRILWIDLSVSVLCLALAEVVLFRKISQIPSAGEYRVNAREVGTFTWHMAGVNVLDASAGFGMLRILVARLLGLEAAGLFAFLQQLLIVVGRYLPANLLANIIRPMLIAKYTEGDVGIVGQGMAIMWKTNVLIVVNICAFFIVGGDYIISLASGGRFEDAGLVMLLLLLALGATSQGQLVSIIMQIFNLSRQLRNQSVLFLLVPLAVWGGSQWGLIGVCTGMVVSQWARNAFSLWWMRHNGVLVRLDWVGIGRATLAVLAIVLCNWIFLQSFNPLVAIAFVGIGLIVGMVLAKPLDSSDMELLHKSLQKRARFFKPFTRVTV